MLFKLRKDWRFPQHWLVWPVVTLLVLGIFFRFTNLGKGVFWYDEAFTYLRISGYTEAEVVQQFANNREIGVQNLQKYQQPNSEKGVTDTIQSLALEEPQLSPLYYTMAWFWMKWFGNSLSVTRSLPAIISLLAFPCVYWLCLELFESPLMGWMAVALLAISPFHLLFAQVARQYSLWTVATLLSSAVILRAIRRNAMLDWGVYAATVALGLYSHLAFGLVAIGHGIYLGIIEKFHLSQRLIAYVFASLAGVLAFAPWLLIVINNSQHVNEAVGKTDSKALWYLVNQWMINTSSIFIDINYDYVENNAKYLLIVLVSILLAYSLYFCGDRLLDRLRSLSLC